MSSFQQYGDATGRESKDLPGFTCVDAESLRKNHPEINRVLTYFENKTGNKRMPMRKDICPPELVNVLPNVCIMVPAFKADGTLDDVVITLMGTNVVEFYGELTGKSALAHPSSVVGRRIFESVKYCLEQRKPTVAQAFSLSEEKNYLRVAVLYIPLSENDTDIDRFFMHVGVYRKTEAEMRDT